MKKLGIWGYGCARNIIIESIEKTTSLKPLTRRDLLAKLSAPWSEEAKLRGLIEELIKTDKIPIASRSRNPSGYYLLRSMQELAEPRAEDLSRIKEINQRAQDRREAFITYWGENKKIPGLDLEKVLKAESEPETKKEKTGDFENGLLFCS